MIPNRIRPGGSAIRLGLRLAVLAALMNAAAYCEATEPKAISPTIVFVCEHGSVKSLIASRWFDRLAAERGLAVRSVSRGVTPDPTVPPPIAKHLAEDGLGVAGFTPAALSKNDLKGVVRVITIGADAGPILRGSPVQVEAWDEIPPASTDYAASRDAIRKRIDVLLTSLEARQPKPRQ